MSVRSFRPGFLLRIARAAPCMAGVACLALATGSLAQGSAATDSPDAETAHASFHAFAATWIDGLAGDARTERERSRMLRRASGGDAGHSYRSIGEEYDIRLKETGRASTPYVGILRYVEHRYECSEPAGEGCRRVDSSEITEIFPFKNGAWVY